MIKHLLFAAACAAPFAALAADPLLEARDASWNALRQQGDVVALDRLIDPAFVLVHSDGKVQHKADYLADLGTRKRVNGEIRNEGVVIREYGDMAVVNGTSVQSAVTDGKPWNGRFRFTRVWVKRGADWVLVSSHSSRLAEGG